MKGQYLGIVALVLTLLVLCLPVSNAALASDQAVSLSHDRPSLVVPRAVTGGGSVISTQGDNNNNGGDDNEGDPDDWGEGNGVKVYGAPQPLRWSDMMRSQGLLEGLRGWLDQLFGVLSLWGR